MRSLLHQKIDRDDMKGNRRHKKKPEKKALTEAEFLSQWEDNDRSVDTIFLPRSRGPLGTPLESEFMC